MTTGLLFRMHRSARSAPVLGLLDGSVDRRSRRRPDDILRLETDELCRLEHALRPDVGDCPDPQATHHLDLNQDIRTHLPGTGKPDGDGAVSFRPCLELSDQWRDGGDHAVHAEVGLV
jgi:hypothetical protein